MPKTKKAASPRKSGAKKRTSKACKVVHRCTATHKNTKKRSSSQPSKSKRTKAVKKRVCTKTGTNRLGNNYRQYKDQAYAYTNKDSKGKVTGRYFNDGKGHEFYKRPDGSSWYRKCS